MGLDEPAGGGGERALCPRPLDGMSKPNRSPNRFDVWRTLQSVAPYPPLFELKARACARIKVAGCPLVAPHRPYLSI